MPSSIRSGPRVGEVQAAGALPAAPREEGRPRHEGDLLLLERLLEELGGVEALRERDPEEEAALRLRPAHPLREVPLERGQHRVPPLAVDLADRLHVAVEEPVLRHLVRHHLAEGAGVEVGALLHLHEARDHRLRRHHPGDAQPRGERLAQRREVEHVAGELALPLRAVVQLGVDLDDRRQVLALVAELAVGVVLDDRSPVVVGELDEPPPPLEAQGHPRRVLEVRAGCRGTSARPAAAPRAAPRRARRRRSAR